MSIRWNGEELLRQVQRARQAAGLPPEELTLPQRLALERALASELADYVELAVCSECERELGEFEE